MLALFRSSFGRRRRIFVSSSLSFGLVALVTGTLPAIRAREMVRETAGGPARVLVAGQNPEEELPALDSTTATRLPARILDTDRSVQVINKRTLQDQLINDPQDAIRDVSGVVRTGSYNGIGENYLVRGFQQQDLIRDGFRAGSVSNNGLGAAGPTDVANLERIEVLKGPAAILYGRGEPGGVVNYLTRLPGFQNSFSLEQQFGSYDFYRTQLNATWNELPQRLALGLDAAYDRNASFIDYIDGERYFVAPSLLWQIDPSTTLTFRGEYSHDHRSTNPGLPYDAGRVVPNVPYSRYLGEPGFTDFTNESFRGLLTFEHRWSEGVRTTLSVHDRHGQEDGNYFILFNFAGPTIDSAGNISRGVSINDFDDNYLTTRLDQVFEWTIYRGAESVTAPASKDKDGKSTPAITRNGGGFPTVKNQLILSAEYDRQDNNDIRVLGSEQPINIFNPRYLGYAPIPLLPFPNFPVNFAELTNSTANAYSLLALDRVSFGELAYLSFGGRLEYFSGRRSLLYPDPNVPFGSSAITEHETIFNPTAGLVVKPVRNVSLYFNYAESTNAFKSFTATTASGATLDPERSRQFELGAKAEFFNQKLLVTVAGFQINKTDVVGTDPDNPLFSINSGDERSRGFEFDVVGEPIPGWRLLANYAYIDARITAAPLGLNVGHRRYGAPENAGGFFTTYEFQGGPLKGFGLGGGMTFSDRVPVDNANSGQLSGWAQTDLVAFYRRGPWRAQVNVKNLFDNEFYYSQNQNNTVQPAQARTIIGSVSVRY